MAADNRVIVLAPNGAPPKRLLGALNRLGYDVTTIDSAAIDQAAWGGEAYPVVLVLAGNTPLDTMGKIVDLRAQLQGSTIIGIGGRSLDVALTAWRAGADDYLPLPVRDRDLRRAIEYTGHIRAARAARMAHEQELRALLVRLGGAPGQAADLPGLHKLMTDLTHQINNPLTPILGMAELLLEDLPLSHPGREYAQVIIASATRIRDLLWRLADIAQPGD
jgi:signal transduction histidine kinase